MTKLSTELIAKDLGLTQRTVQVYCKEGFIPAHQTWAKGKLIYVVDKDVYSTWKHTNFHGKTRGKISKRSLLLDELNKSQIKELSTEWLHWCTTGILTGKPIAPRTIELYDYYFNYFLNKLPPNPVRPIVSVDNLRRVLSKITIESYSTRRHVYDAVRSIAKFLIEKELLSSPDREKLTKLRPKRFLPARKTVLRKDQLALLINYLEKCSDYAHYYKLLNITLIKFLAMTGLRAREACNLKLEEVDLEARIISINLGKGNKNRKVGVTKELSAVLHTYLKVRLKKFTDRTFLFCTRTSGPICPQQLCKRIRHAGQKIGLDITPHGLRRTFVTVNVNQGKPLVHLQIACGHSDITTTRGYCMTSEDEVIDAMKGW